MIEFAIGALPFFFFCLGKHTCIPYDRVPSRIFVLTARIDHFAFLDELVWMKRSKVDFDAYKYLLGNLSRHPMTQS